MFLFNKKCCKYFCDSISIDFTEKHLDLIFDASHTLCMGIKMKGPSNFFFIIIIMSHSRVNTPTAKTVSEPK